MIILGRCPNCNAEDTITIPRERESWDKALCEKCNASWSNWIELVHSKIGKEKGLKPVAIDCGLHSMVLSLPGKHSIPHSRLIITVLNTAVMTHFKLRVLFATEGGFWGSIGREPIELRNTDDAIGLSDDLRLQNNSKCRKVLEWYGELLRWLFERELIEFGKNFGKGTILKLSSEGDDSLTDARILLWLALFKKTRSKGFATQVFQHCDIARSNPFTSPYVAGLTDEDIVRLFVPPPLTKAP